VPPAVSQLEKRPQHPLPAVFQEACPL